MQRANPYGLQERYPQGRLSGLYDLRNEVALEARLGASTVAEPELAHEPLASLQPGDVVLNDRGFTGYRWLVAVRLKSGELEVLATSLLDPVAYPPAAMAAVHWQRCGTKPTTGG